MLRSSHRAAIPRFLLAYALLTAAAISLQAQTLLAPGDLVFTAYNSDNTGVPDGTGIDAFTFLLLVDVEAGTIVYFTDNGWLAAGGFRNGESVLTWTVGAALPALTQVTVSQTPLEASTGTVSGSGLNLSASGDQVFAFQMQDGTEEADFALVAALQMNGGWDEDAESSTTSARPPSLVEGLHALAISPEVDNAAYDCAVQAGSVDEIRAAVQDPSNWVADNAAPFGQPRCVFGALPVEWARLEARVEAGVVRLEWETAAEYANAGFEVQHREAASSGGRWSTAGFVAGAGTTESGRAYRHETAGLWPGRHAFRVKQIDYDGGASHSPVVEVDVELAEGRRLAGPFPHPVADRAEIRFAVSHEQQVRATLHDVRGRLVAELFTGRVPAHRARGIRVDAGGLPAGVYVLRLEGATFAESRLVTVL